EFKYTRDFKGWVYEPQRTSPATRTPTLGAKKRTKMVAIIMNRKPTVVFLAPYRSVNQPAMMSPMISPARAPLDRPDCHAAETAYFWSSSSQVPYFLLKTGDA